MQADRSEAARHFRRTRRLHRLLRVMVGHDAGDQRAKPGAEHVLEKEVQRQALHCIGCGACQTFSDLYNLIGGNVYGGPHQAITAPLMMNAEEYKFLGEAQTLGEGVNEVCPVKIDFCKLLVHNRHDFVKQGLSNRNEKWFFYAWKKIMLKRDLMSWTGINTRKHMMESLIKSQENLRQMPSTAPKSFNEQWREKQMIK